MAITSADAIAAGSLRWEHRDPFDRMLAAQAVRTQALLVSGDPMFGDLAGLCLAW
ncbi:MAG: type II toxin-antitoxin system VapC family toxin [Actinomycetota bacterium]